MKKIIHIASDEKFINSAYSQFEDVYPGENHFYLIVEDCTRPLKYVDLKPEMTLISRDKKKLQGLPKKFDNAKVVCFHSVDEYSSRILNYLSSRFKIIWLFWGFEIYNNPLFLKNKSITGPLTFSSSQIAPKFQKSPNILRNFYRKKILTYRTYFISMRIRKALMKVDYCGILYKEEYEMVKSQLNTNIKYFKFSYYPIEMMLSNIQNYVNNDCILLGNSATRSNNHLEIFEILKEYDLKNKQIITPLSYGEESYRKLILKQGANLFNGNFCPILDFLARDEYYNILQKCGIVIMNHYRQQAVGNVMVMLWMGAKVFLDERNSLYHYLKRIGIHIYSIQMDLSNNNSEVFSLLKRTEQEQNRKILKTEIGKEVLLNSLKYQFDLLLNEH